MDAQRVALDTDIGTDVDDLLALTTLLGSPELELTAVTTVYGETLLRARIAARALRLAGASGIPVVPGAGPTRSGRPVWWAGHEGRLLADLEDEQVETGRGAAEVLAGAGTVIAIGPLTDVADALEQPGRAIERLTLMGADFGSGGSEHNLRSDAAAAAAVFASGVPLAIIGIEQTERVAVRADFVADLAGRAGLGALLAAEIRQFEEFAGRPSVPHDALAVLLCARPDLFAIERGRITVDDEGGVAFDRDPAGPHAIVTDLEPRGVLAEVEQRILAVLEAGPFPRVGACPR